jgi:hypothetical protein
MERCLVSEKDTNLAQRMDYCSGDLMVGRRGWDLIQQKVQEMAGPKVPLKE